MSDNNRVFPEGYSQFPAGSNQPQTSTNHNFSSTDGPSQFSQQQNPTGTTPSQYLNRTGVCSCGGMGFTEEFTTGGLVFMIICFPWGFFCVQDLKERKCVKCKKKL